MKGVVMNLKKNKDRKNENILNDIFKEIRLLRKEVSLFIPTEDIESYSNSKRIKNSYKKALKQYPISV